MIDCQLYGPNPGWHHLTNLLFHIANTLLLFGVWSRMTGAMWRSALIAALFAWHPLHVESVAWVSERKDVLSAFFWFLALGAYGRYAENSKVQGPKSKVRGCYLLALLFFVLGLLSKPMVVTLPFTLLLLDYWPLRRSEITPWWKLVLEKLPFFVLAAIASVVTFLVQRSVGAVLRLAFQPPAQRIANALVSYVRYLGKMFWPVHLGVFYPLMPAWPAAVVIGATVLLLGVTILALYFRCRNPYFLVGWLWFLGTLVPVIGLVQVGRQSMADRYSYVPLVGIFVLLVWGLADWSKAWPARGRQILAMGASILLFGCIVLTGSQVHFWRNSSVLFDHLLTINTNNYIAHYYFGRSLEDHGEDREAMLHFNAAQQLQPDWASPLFHLGVCLERQAQIQTAMDCYESALSREPNYNAARISLAQLLMQQGKLEAAANQYQEGLRYDPKASDLHYNFGNLLVAQGKLAEAVSHYRESLRLNPDSADAHNNLGAVLLRRGAQGEAVEQFQAALKLRPDFAEAEDQLGGALQKLGQGEEARRHFARAVQLRPDLAHARLKLGLLLAQQQQFDQARGQLERAVELEPTNDAAWYNLAGVLAAQGQWAAAARDFGKVLELKPGDVEAHARLGAVLAQAGQSAAAIAEYERAAQLSSHREPRILAALDQAYAQAGRWAEAIQTAQAAQAAAEALQQPALAAEAARRLERYRAGHGQE